MGVKFSEQLPTSVKSNDLPPKLSNKPLVPFGHGLFRTSELYSDTDREKETAEYREHERFRHTHASDSECAVSFSEPNNSPNVMFLMSGLNAAISIRKSMEKLDRFGLSRFRIT